ncbi:MAG: hypothetical protein NC548_42905 [Lachnospiraceae bacterium]|nr:hypothetical protein [Lachnospiraceae bacterium]
MSIQTIADIVNTIMSVVTVVATVLMCKLVFARTSYNKTDTEWIITKALYLKPCIVAVIIDILIIIVAVTLEKMQ